MAVLQQLEFFLLRYAGDVTRGESINLGVAVIAPGNGEPGGAFADVRFIRNWRRLHCFDPLADIEEVQAIEREVRQDLQDPEKRAQLLKRLSDSYSNVIRFDRLQGCLAQSPALELERLSALYLETPMGTEKRDQTGRQRILNVMRDELEKAGVLSLMLRDVAMAEYTRPGDPLKLDLGYAAGDSFKFLQAVSLSPRVDSAMMLAARFPQIAAGMKQKNGAEAWLTAVVDDDLDRNRDEVTFALEMMQDSGIVVARAAQMPKIAEEIRLDLRP